MLPKNLSALLTFIFTLSVRKVLVTIIPEHGLESKNSHTSQDKLEKYRNYSTNEFLLKSLWAGISAFLQQMCYITGKYLLSIYSMTIQSETTMQKTRHDNEKGPSFR
jgi:hypothetical protein